MKVLALYRQKNLPILRRIIFPFSVLAERTQKFAFQQQLEFDIGPGYSYDVVVLQNYILDDSELEQCRVYLEDGQKYIIYDLTNISLLADVQVRKTLALCRYVTVPNEHMRKELEGIVKSVKVVPSVLDVPFYMSGRTLVYRYALRPFTIGCFGNHDWHLVKDALTQIRQKYSRTAIIGDNWATDALGELVTQPVQLLSDDYPLFLHSCDIGLLPREGMTGADTIWAYEYGIACKPVVASAASDYQYVMQKEKTRDDFPAILRVEHKTQLWLNAIMYLIENAADRAEMGNSAFRYANLERNTLKADLYLRAYTQFLPHLR